jgi:hypothetical protein
METYKIPHAMVKLGGVAAMTAAIMMIAGFLLHPAGEDFLSANSKQQFRLHTPLLASISAVSYQRHLPLHKQRDWKCSVETSSPSRRGGALQYVRPKV